MAPLLLFGCALPAFAAAADDFVMIKGGVLRAGRQLPHPAFNPPHP